MERTVTIYVMEGCPGCDEAHRVAAEVGRRYPAVRIEVVDLGQAGTVRPPSVFGVPTYLLDGRVISLGNPDAEWLAARLAAETGVRHEHGCR